MARDLPLLMVEGRDDLFSIAELLNRHGIDMHVARRPLNIQPAKDTETGAEGVGPLLDAMEDTIRQTAAKQPVGFVMDIDTTATDRWKGVSSRLRAAGLSPPIACPATGYIGTPIGYQHSVGVWLMPDCSMESGKLEHLLHSLIPTTDALRPHAEHATTDAKKLGAKFSEADQIKAIMHCWLAWQETPGLPYGTALTAKYLAHDSPEALAFLSWLKRLFTLPLP